MGWVPILAKHSQHDAEKLKASIEQNSSIMMPLPPSGFTALVVEGTTCSYNVPYHSLSYYYADDRQMATVLIPEVTGTSCPHCGAPVKLVNGRGKCNYCESFI